MNVRTCLVGTMIAISFLFGFGAICNAEGSGLVDLLVKNLGVTTQQAEGGAGAIFNTAKQNMDLADFLKVKTSMPEIEPLMAATPKIEQGTGALGGVSSMIGGSTGTIGKLVGLYDSFSKLGLSKDMVGQFIPQVLEYSKSKGGEMVSNLLKTALQ